MQRRCSGVFCHWKITRDGRELLFGNIGRPRGDVITGRANKILKDIFPDVYRARVYFAIYDVGRKLLEGKIGPFQIYSSSRTAVQMKVGLVDRVSASKRRHFPSLLFEPRFVSEVLFNESKRRSTVARNETNFHAIQQFYPPFTFLSRYVVKRRDKNARSRRLQLNSVHIINSALTGRPGQSFSRARRFFSSDRGCTLCPRAPHVPVCVPFLPFFRAAYSIIRYCSTPLARRLRNPRNRRIRHSLRRITAIVDLQKFAKMFHVSTALIALEVFV